MTEYNAGIDYTEAKAKAQAFANRTGQACQLWQYKTLFFFEPYGTSKRGLTTAPIEGAEIILPETKP